jgi:GDP/UDP-N,N'-diacetylbacillosamine 2-epimerase (hydrolysing)
LGGPGLKLGLLTSSRADFGIYTPLIQLLEQDMSIELEIIAFGTHHSSTHGNTINEIHNNTSSNVVSIETHTNEDSQLEISKSYGSIVMQFAAFWNQHKYDIVLCLGDRFEMAAAVNAGVPLHTNFAHLHGGETTLGAIDNIYRHQITLASKWHFTSTLPYAKRVQDLIGTDKNIFYVGALSLVEVSNFEPKKRLDFCNEFGLSTEPFILTTFHPETADSSRIPLVAKEWSSALAKITDKMNVVITMPNADTSGSIVRAEMIKLYQANKESITLIENFGRVGYFNAMSHCTMMLGNTSSGIIEGASFDKYVINVGDRQKGRFAGENVIHVRNDAKEIVNAASGLNAKMTYSGVNPYYKSGTAKAILQVLKQSR